MGTKYKEYDVMVCPKCKQVHSLDGIHCRYCNIPLKRQTIKPMGAQRSIP